MPLGLNQQFDKFRILRRLGAGGFGTVYLALDTDLDRRVAIKELYDSIDRDGAAFKRFWQEAKVLGKLNHPNIVTLYDRKTVAGTVYLIMEYVAGGSLAERLKRESPLPAAQALQIADEVCEALSIVHEQGIIHRDIKPENILLTEGGHAKVADFGIAHVPRDIGGTSMTRTNFQPGTLDFMSPEQLRGADKLTSASDIYQVAAVLHKMLTGRHYFDHEALRAQAMRESGVSNPNSPLVQGRLMMLISQAIEGRVQVQYAEQAELAQLLSEILSAPADARLTGVQLGRILRNHKARIEQPRFELEEVARRAAAVEREQQEIQARREAEEKTRLAAIADHERRVELARRQLEAADAGYQPLLVHAGRRLTVEELSQVKTSLEALPLRTWEWIYIENLPARTPSEDIEQLASFFGKVQFAKTFVGNPNDGVRYFGVVQMSSQEEAKTAASKLNGTIFVGHTLLAQVVGTKEEALSIGMSRPLYGSEVRQDFHAADRSGSVKPIFAAHIDGGTPKHWSEPLSTPDAASSAAQASGHPSSGNSERDRHVAKHESHVAPSGSGQIYLYVGNLPYSIDDRKLRGIFEGRGQIISAEIMREKGTGRSLGFGMVVMSDLAEAQRAVDFWHLQRLGKRPLQVKIAKNADEVMKMGKHAL